MLVSSNSVAPISQGWRCFTPDHQGSFFRFWHAQKSLFCFPLWGSLSYQRMVTSMVEASKTSNDVSFDKSKFDVPYNLLALRVLKQHSGFVSKTLSGYVFDMPRVRHIVPDPSSPDTRLIILSKKITDTGLSELPAERLAAIRSVSEVEVVPYKVVLDYNYWPADHILKGLLPPECEIQSSFETIGHIAHLNIRDEMIPYKHLIASVILEKNMPKIKTILNKVGTITNQFRVPTFEVLAGEPSLVTEVKQHGATFRLDYGMVYWNSRLEHEHHRLVSQFQPKQVICDMFAGIGPFAIPAAQKGCIVYANDLNPHSTKYLRINAEINKVFGRVHVYNMDAREFVRDIVSRGNQGQEECQANVPATQEGCTADNNDLSLPLCAASEEEREHSKSSVKNIRTQRTVLEEHGRPWERIDHFVMNLPASALEFLDIFQGLISKETWKGTISRVHCYCFMRANETIQDVLKRAESILGGSIHSPNIWEVRNVAPNKAMLCLSFNLPEEVAFAEDRASECTSSSTVNMVSNLETVVKRPRLEATLASCDLG